MKSQPQVGGEARNTGLTPTLAPSTSYLQMYLQHKRCLRPQRHPSAFATAVRHLSITLIANILASRYDERQWVRISVINK